MNLYQNNSTGTPEFSFATVAEVDTTKGLRLQFDGESAATSKYYKCNTSCSYSVGDRVKISKDSGTYVVDYVVGNPQNSSGFDYEKVYESTTGIMTGTIAVDLSAYKAILVVLYNYSQYYGREVRILPVDGVEYTITSVTRPDTSNMYLCSRQLTASASGLVVGDAYAVKTTIGTGVRDSSQLKVYQIYGIK